MKVINVGEKESLFNNFIAQLRDVSIQEDSMRFRRNLERIGEVIAYELSKTLNYQSKDIRTPLGECRVEMLSDEIVIATILRAGLPLHNGLLNYFDNAQNCFVSAYRRHTHGDEFDIQIEYLASPDITGKVLILADPMLATGSSLLLCYQAILAKGTPSHTHIVSAIGSQQGVEYLQNNLPENVSLWIGAIDDELTNKGYIVPGLGDAGDLAFGSKV